MNEAIRAEALRLIAVLGLERHPEGGWYRETWRSDAVIPRGGLGPDWPDPRSCGTSIYYLLAGGEVSRVHRLRGDEVWHWYAGSRLLLHLFPAGGPYRRLELGPRAATGPCYQAVVPGGCRFGATVAESDGFVLAGCTLAPGFDSDDFKLSRRRDLLDDFPEQTDLIHSLTR